MDMEADDFRAWREWLQLLFPLLIFAVIYLWRQVRVYSRGKQLREIAPYLNGRAVLRPFGAPAISGLYLGHAYRMRFPPGSRNSPGRFELALDFPFDFVLDIRARGAAGGIESILFRGQTVQTGDRGLDEAVVVRLDKEPERARLYLDNPAYRRAVLEAVGQGFQLIRYTGKGVFLSRAGEFLGKESVGVERLQQYLTLAGRLLGR
jgi:hypothetical protein